jgi:hypothetical protein
MRSKKAQEKSRRDAGLSKVESNLANAKGLRVRGLDLWFPFVMKKVCQVAANLSSKRTLVRDCGLDSRHRRGYLNVVTMFWNWVSIKVKP